MISSSRRLKYLRHVLVLCVPSFSLTAIVDEFIEVSVIIKTIYGQEVEQPIKVTVFRDDTRAKAPYLVLNHSMPATEAEFAKTLAVLRSAASLPYVDLTPGIVVGQSFGGMTSIALSTKAVPGLVAAVNFAGGGGGKLEPSSRKSL